MRLPDNKVRRLFARALGCVLFCGMTLGLSGCRHKPQVTPLPAIQKPIDLVEIPPHEDLPLLEAPPIDMLPTPRAAAASRPRERRRVAAKVPPPVVAPAAVPAPTVGEASAETTSIGALTAGGEANPQTKQDATDLIASIEKQLNALPAQILEERKTQVSQIRNFWRDAQEALKSGDAEGARTLATKAKLLLDDMQK